MRWLLKGFVVSAIPFSIFTWAPEVTIEIPTAYKVASVGVATQEQEESTSIFFVGDIMLGRGVEALVEKHGMGYPFEQVEAFINSPDLAVGNFEGVVPHEHVKTPSMAFKFSIRNEYLTHLRTVGFDVLSLANNHSLDHGIDALDFTKQICENLGVICGGSPNMVTADSIAVKQVGTKKIGFLFLSTVWKDMPEEEILKHLETLRQTSEFQIAYIHWGNEYELIHSRGQEQLAKMLIDNGIDAVVGHHPHVVQDIALYKGKVIFYSLGNFIFDQYFSEEVKEGLGIGMTLTDSKVRYRLVLFRNDIARSQPHTATRSDSTDLFSRILENIKHEPGVDVGEGILLLEHKSQE